AVKDQTGVEASVDTKGRLVLSNRDGRGIKVEDNVSVPTGANDVHSLVVRDAVNGNNKKGVDLGAADAWNTTGANGSILIGENSFGDVKNAHGVQDAAIYNDGLTKTKQATAASNAYNAFHTEEQKALDKFKDASIKALDSFIGTTAKVGQEATKIGENAKAEKLKDLIANAKDMKTISDAVNTFDGTAAATVDDADAAYKTAIGTASQNYATTVEAAGQKAVGTLAAYDNTGDVQTLSGALNTMVAAATTAKTAGFGGFNAFGTAMGTFETTAKPIGNKEVDFVNLAAEEQGALRLANTAFNNGANPTTAKEITDLFASLKNQTTKADANATIDKLTKKLEEVVNAADGKTMDTAEAQQGMVAHSYLQFFAGV
ncbi:hypothetical protein KJR01_09585, partial [Campylobacter sp. 2018MI10]|nr:hypothetical protein [Campylobacter sp. 2018MI10]